jgi:hypothetical protein
MLVLSSYGNPTSYNGLSDKCKVRLGSDLEVFRFFQIDAIGDVYYPIA